LCAHYLEKAALAAAQTLQADLSSLQEVSLLQLLKLVPVTLEEFRAEAERIAELTGAKLICGDKVSTKGVLRTLEKCLIKALASSSPILDFYANRDPVRCQFQCTTSTMALAVQRAVQASGIWGVVRWKHRYGPQFAWQDNLINVRLASTRVVCEVQIALTKMCLQRAEMGGHHSYDDVRGLQGLLKICGGAMPAEVDESPVNVDVDALQAELAASKAEVAARDTENAALKRQVAVLKAQFTGQNSRCCVVQ